MTIDSEQLTVVVSLRDELNLFIYFRRKFLNCQLSIVNCQLIFPLTSSFMNVSYSVVTSFTVPAMSLKTP